MSNSTVPVGTEIELQSIEDTAQVTEAFETDSVPIGRGGVTVHMPFGDFKGDIVKEATESYIGEIALNSELPDNPDNKPIWGDVTNTKIAPTPDDGSSDDIYNEFLDKNNEPLVVPASTSGKFSYNGQYWSYILIYKNLLLLIENWSPRKYKTGEQCVHNGGLWAAKDYTTAAADEPGVSPLWRPISVPSIRLNKITENAATTFTYGDTRYADLGNTFLSMVDKAIREINVINSNYKYVSLKAWANTIKTDGTSAFNCTLTLSNNLTPGDPEDKDILCYVPSLDVPDDGIVKLYFKDNLSSTALENVEIVFDTTGFIKDLLYAWTFGEKKLGVLNAGFINNITSTDGYPIGHDTYNVFTGAPFVIQRSLKNITCWGNVADKTFKFVRLIRDNNDRVIFDIAVYQNGAQISLLRSILLPENFSGLYTDSMPWGGSGSPNRDYGLTLTLDCDVIKSNFPAGAFTIVPLGDDVISLKKGDYKRALLADYYDISSGVGYADYRGMWYAPGTYRRNTIGIRIPEGTQSLEYTGGMDKNANILFGDKNGKLIGYGWTDEDGVSKYSGDEIKTSMTIPVPAGAKFVHASTLYANVNSFRLYAVGNFKHEVKSDYYSIQDAILDHTVPDGVYTAQKYQFRKVGTNINYVQILDGNNLALADDYSYKGELIQGQHTGQLVHYKNGLYYFINGQTIEVYTQDEQGNVTYLFNQSMYPDVWALCPQQQQGRAVLEVLDDGSVLFALMMEVDGNRFYCLFKRKPDGTLTKCFKYSNDFYHKDWLDPSDPDYNKVGFGNGAPLGEWSFAYGAGLIFATEYGAGTSKYWAQNNTGLAGNARGVSSCAWVSPDDGDTWYKMFDLNDKKNPLNGESDDNWVYFTSTEYRKLAHIHTIRYDNYGRRILITNGDGQDYLWHLSIDDLLAFLTTATAVDPEVFPTANTPTPVWSSFMFCIKNEFEPNMNYNTMRPQYTAIFPIQQGLLLGHDAPREFMYLVHRNGYETNDVNVEPTYMWEQSTDFDTAEQYRVSQTLTDGFVMNMVRFGKGEPVLIGHSASGKYCRIWATYNGVEHRKVFESEEKVIKFGCRIFKHPSGDLLVSTDAALDSWHSGYYILRKNRLD
ncbi:hypothetical protein [Arachidicoccus terrestris]|uniref:hypothetical protein n=1 Tax=Arachidicoccus terrestris TaxID=2875539 RepID=UPI001CC50760|nr:hypothetical protein [Arachidicoccus terrestris]UAY56271.1 hypothetical protein K9M52_04435 [Arachidicoccus terrestris]